jgi:hypothetical protein
MNQTIDVVNIVPFFSNPISWGLVLITGITIMLYICWLYPNNECEYEYSPNYCIKCGEKKK